MEHKFLSIFWAVLQRSKSQNDTLLMQNKSSKYSLINDVHMSAVNTIISNLLKHNFVILVLASLNWEKKNSIILREFKKKYNCHSLLTCTTVPYFSYLREVFTFKANCVQ